LKGGIILSPFTKGRLGGIKNFAEVVELVDTPS
jgi:hypothetical protein